MVLLNEVNNPWSILSNIIAPNQCYFVGCIGFFIIYSPTFDHL